MNDACRVCPARLMEDAGRMLSGSLTDIVPPQAQIHLLNAQRELLLAVVATIEHNTSRATPRGRATRARGTTRSPRRPSRVELD